MFISAGQSGIRRERESAGGGEPLQFFFRFRFVRTLWDEIDNMKEWIREKAYELIVDSRKYQVKFPDKNTRFILNWKRKVKLQKNTDDKKMIIASF